MANIEDNIIEKGTTIAHNEPTTSVVPNVDVELKCLKCSKMYSFPIEKDDYLAHLYLEHRLVIADVEDISLLEDYLRFWAEEFSIHELSEYCTTMFLDQLPDGTLAKNEKYYLLCDILPKDLELRRELEQKRLTAALERHQFEVTDRSFSKECLFCRDVISGLRADYFEHLFAKHFLLVGKPENLVYVDELLVKLEYNLDKLVCLYCEKIFKDRVTLKEHMRKKGHKRINPSLKDYDKYFLCNYNKETKVMTNSSKSKQRVHHLKRYYHQQQQQQSQPHRQQCRRQSERTTDGEELETESVEFERRFAVDFDAEHDSEWSDWDGEQQQTLKCLYCKDSAQNFIALKLHMMDEHNLDFESAIRDLNFYQRIKIVNFVRRQMCSLRCISCDLKFDDEASLAEHMDEAGHCTIGEQSHWDKPEYFFPFLENDELLCVLDDLNDDDVDEAVVRIISEDTVAEINKDAERLSLENFSF